MKQVREIMIISKSAFTKIFSPVVLITLLVITITGCRSQPGNPPLGVEFLDKASPELIRVMSFNVGWDSIFPDDDLQNDTLRQDSRGAEFVRILKAVKPDILCLQEINPTRDPQQVGDILDAVLPLEAGQTWQTFSGQDNVLAARFDLTMATEKLIIPGEPTNFGHAMALFDLPNTEYENDLYLICTHFPALGGQANVQARQEHADAIVAWIGDAKTPGGEIDLPFGMGIMVLGDFNVYDTDPAHHLVTLITGNIANEGQYGPDISPDWDGTDLADALPRHNGVGEAVYTWRDDTQEFNPGALDRILYTDSVISVKDGFVLNTEMMTAEELTTVGLRSGDVMLDSETGRYDHLPLAVDISIQDIPPGQ